MKSCQEESVGRLIYKTGLVLRNYAENLLKPYGLTVEQLFLLKNMSSESGVTQRQLCELSEKQPANMTRILDRIEGKGRIVRKPNPTDRRSALVFLTEEGEMLLAEVSSLFESYSGRMTEGIEQEEERVFKDILARIEGNIQSLTQDVVNKPPGRG